MEVEGPGLVENVDIALGERRRYIPGQVLILEVKVELGASAAEDCSEEYYEEQGEGDGPEYVALAAVPALEVSIDYGEDSASHV